MVHKAERLEDNLKGNEEGERTRMELTFATLNARLVLYQMVFEFQPSTRSTDISVRWTFKLASDRETKLNIHFGGFSREIQEDASKKNVK